MPNIPPTAEEANKQNLLERAREKAKKLHEKMPFYKEKVQGTYDKMREKLGNIRVLGGKKGAESEEEQEDEGVVGALPPLDHPQEPLPAEPFSLGGATRPQMERQEPNDDYDVNMEPVIVILRAKGIEAYAQHRADDSLEVDDTRYKGVLGFFKSVADNVTRPYRRGRAYVHAKKDIMDTQNIFGDVLLQSEHDEEMSYLQSRFMVDGTELIHQEKEVGEEKEEITDMNDPRRLELIHLMITSLDTTVTKEQFETAQQEIFEEYDMPMDDSIMTDNMWNIVTAYRNDANRGRAIEKISRMKIVLGTAALGLRTGPHYGLTDKILNKLEKSALTRWINPTTLAVGVAGTVGVMSSVGRVSMKAVAPIVGSAALSGTLGYMQASESFKRDLFNDRRDAALSQEFSSESKRRQALMAEHSMDGLTTISTRFNMMDANVLFDALSRSQSNIVANASTNTLALQDRITVFNDALSHLAQARARVSLSNRMRIDLIRYSSGQSVEAERMMLDVNIMKTRATLREEYDAIHTQATLEGQPFSSETFEDIYESELEATEQTLLDTNINDTHKHATKLRRKHALKAGAIAAGSSLAFAGLTYGISSTYQWVNGYFKAPSADVVANTFMIPGSDTHLSLLGGEDLTPNEAGTAYDIIKDGQIKVAGLTMDTDGTFTAESVAKLESAGYTVNEALGSAQNIAVAESVAMTPRSYLTEHHENLVQLSKLDWASNNTAYSDFNELQLDWGGTSHNGLMANGDYSFSVAGLTDNGSVMGTESFAANAEGKVYVALSITRDTQDMVFTFPVGNDGQAIIPADSDAAKMLFSEQSGKAVFNGNFAHAMYFEEPPVPGGAPVRGVSLATHIGSGQASDFTMTTTGTTIENIPANITVQPPVMATDAAGNAYAVPFPIFMRKELEKNKLKDEGIQNPSHDPHPSLPPLPDPLEPTGLDILPDDDLIGPTPPSPLTALDAADPTLALGAADDGGVNATPPLIFPGSPAIPLGPVQVDGSDNQEKEAERAKILEEMKSTFLRSKVHGISYPAVPLIKLIKKAEELGIPEDQWPTKVANLYNSAKKELIQSVNKDSTKLTEKYLTNTILDKFEVARWLGLNVKDFGEKFPVRYGSTQLSIAKLKQDAAFNGFELETILHIEQMGLRSRYEKSIRNYDEKVQRARDFRKKQEKNGGVKK